MKTTMRQVTENTERKRVADMRNYVKGAFTLIEMLVIVAILAVLAMLLFPALGRVRESGRATKCVANLKQLQLAVMNFAQDGNTPRAVSTQLQDDEGKWYEAKGWVAWANYAGGSAAPTGGNAYPQTGGFAKRCITNGTLYAYARSEDIYMCPTLAATKAYSAYKRGYSMNSQASQVSFISEKAVSRVLFGDDRALTNINADCSFGTNEVSTLHGGNKGHVVFLDGHVEKL